MCPNQVSKASRLPNCAQGKLSRNWNREIKPLTRKVGGLHGCRFGGGGGWGVPPPLSGRAWGGEGGRDKDFWSRLCSNEKAKLETRAERSLHTPEPASQVGGFE